MILLALVLLLAGCTGVYVTKEEMAIIEADNLYLYQRMQAQSYENHRLRQLMVKECTK